MVFKFEEIGETFGEVRTYVKDTLNIITDVTL